MTAHLGSRISALVDGQLDVAATERALAHVASCSQCAAELCSARSARATLASVDEPSPAPDLTARLLSLAAGAPQEQTTRDPFAAPAPGSRSELASYGVTSSAGWLGRPTVRGDLRQKRSTARLVAGSMAGLGAVAAMLFVLGERPAVVPSSHPGADLGLLGRAVTERQPAAFDTGTQPAGEAGSDSVAWLQAHRWSFPAQLPDGWAVTAVRWSGGGSDMVEVDVVGPEGSVVVTEQQGHLETQALTGAPTGTVGGRLVYVLSYEPWHVVWQADSTVVQVVAAESNGSLEELVGAFPGDAFDDGVPARITRGWDTVAGALERP
ncbi:anti-sigma factor [Cellulomonas sp. URHE0023]|uniref:anti-sigma factor family protein n=1 Tax=Cellulomonas sp. URHE0023 TaxID=1380354 RepID=UPI00048880E2|nr:zf-HC2 domain-containing protein [Cellulomonas sp. URHE0023]